MRITKEQLKQIIKEELEAVLESPSTAVPEWLEDDIYEIRLAFAQADNLEEFIENMIAMDRDTDYYNEWNAKPAFKWMQDNEPKKAATASAPENLVDND